MAARLITTAVERQAAANAFSLVLTGGRTGTACLAALSEAPGDAVDWRRTDLWWGDERFLPMSDPERNETTARSALLESVELNPSRVHPMPARRPGLGLDAAAAQYDDELGQWLGANGRRGFDVVLLGIGEDGHVASLFPEQPALHVHDRLAVGVHGAPKPPPERITMTLAALERGDQVWLLASGADKAAAVRLAVEPGAGPFQVPAAGVRGRLRTLLLIDEAAARDLPADLGRPLG